ncbi:NAD(P)-dependent oxidoreductase [Pseudescherichia vulneris]|uniref:NAD(P)-dependent oxidoreductase n=1 Tax=Pseudescherichia vulneris TaxID=566 RepID=UPI0028D39C54|nr:NAD(P)-dependent oxidoreductase [Pseudescherichia vulneris]
MKIALIGSTGYVGSRLLAEALEREHQVTAIVKNSNRLSLTHGNLKATLADASSAGELAAAIQGHDVVISAYNPGADSDGSVTQTIIDGVKRANVSRLLVVGGAGTLLLSSGERVVDQKDFPAEWKEGALRTARFLNQLQEEKQLDWVFLSPAAVLVPGERTGQYRVGKDHLLVDEAGASQISLEDYAVAMLDEAEQPQHHCQRYTVAY